MEAAFETLKKSNLNTVGNLVKWMKDANVIQDSEAEAKVYQMFDEAQADGKNVEFAKFKEVLDKMASDQHKTAEDFFKSLMEKMPDGVGAAASALATAVGLK